MRQEQFAECRRRNCAVLPEYFPAGLFCAIRTSWGSTNCPDPSFLGLFLKVSICRNDIDFFARQGDLTQESFVDFKENQRCIAEKDTSFGVLHTFQKRPSFSRRFRDQTYLIPVSVIQGSAAFADSSAGSCGRKRNLPREHIFESVPGNGLLH